MEGTLFPSDGVPGCKFEVRRRTDGGDRYDVILLSPYSGGIVDKAVGLATAAEVGTWLEGRTDY
jgi:hypothetical protein